MRYIVFLLTALVFLSVFPARTCQADVSVEASLSTLSFPVDSYTTLNIKVSGASRISNIELPTIPGLSIENQGQSSSIKIVNGSMSSSLTNRYVIQAQQPGNYTLPPITIHAGGDTATTKPLSFEVTATSSGKTTGNTGKTPDDIAFIRMAEQGEHYLGEIVPVQIKAYFNQKYRIEKISPPLLKGDGVVMSQLKDKPLQSTENISGVDYTVLSWDTTLSGIKVGEHSINIDMDALVLVPQKRRPKSPFGGGLFDDDDMMNDPFFDSFFGGATRKPLTITSSSANFSVIPLPTPEPKTYNGAVGDFSIKASSSQKELEVGEPLKITVEISGKGNFDHIEAPIFPEGTAWKTYSPTASFKSEGNSYTGTKVFEMALVAKNDTLTEIPALSLSYFDPLQKAYKTISSEPIPIKLKKTDRTTAAASTQSDPQMTNNQAEKTISKTPMSESNKDITHLAPLKLQIGQLQAGIKPIFFQLWYQGLCIVAALCIIAIAIRQLRQRHNTKNPQLVLHRKRKVLLTTNLRTMEQAFRAGNSADFLSAAKTAIQNQLGLVWHLEPAAITLTDIHKNLAPDSPLIGIFAAADAGIYGGVVLSDEEMQRYLKELPAALEAIK